MMTRQLPLLTTSSAKAYRRCNRLYSFQYLHGYRTVRSSDALTLGTLWHLGLEAWWLAAKAVPREPDAWHAAALVALSGESDPYQHAKAKAMLTAYHERWRDMTWDGEPIEVLAVEAEFVAPLINPMTGKESRTWQRGGKIDAIVRAGGLVRTVEHKSAGEDIGPGSDYWARLRLNLQISNYHVGARVLGYEPAGCIYDVLKKPTQRPREATPVDQRKWTKPTKARPEPQLYANQREYDETPDEYHDRILEAVAEAPGRYFDRCEVVRLEEEERDAAFSVWQTALQIRESEKLDRWPMNDDACMQYGSKCGFWDVCTHAGSLDDERLFRKVEQAHEELSRVVQEPEAAE